MIMKLVIGDIIMSFGGLHRQLFSFRKSKTL
jgi:hypothetical protein